ncbi:hypothetical protein FA014_01015 [Cellulomonas hominis]|uniref:Uncharacterized protein n=1 Tax=Cellulomonas hominis TaxID=156981 RepID=A0A7Z8K3X2_9CELL|nr:hypothetical protein [Cellulomonas hominis]TKR27311.1 hypothetical protein FA014_01015 [Cellulomonas hominis]
MELLEQGHPTLREWAEPLMKAELLASVFTRPMTATDLQHWIQRGGSWSAVDELIAGDSVKRTRDGGLRIKRPRHRYALDALQRDLGL